MSGENGGFKMFNILTLNKIAACGIECLDADKFTVTDDAAADADGIILRSFSMHDMELPKSLKAVARAGAGTNNIPIDKCTDNGIVVFNSPGANANAVKELVIAGLLLASRDVIGGIKWANTLTGDDVAKQVEKGKSAFAGHEIKGKTLGVIGLGAIGVKVANAAESLGMNVIGFDPYLSIKAAWKLDSSTKKANSVEEIFEKSDYITLHLPLTDDTRNMIDKNAISKMKDGAVILNFARGALVDNDAVKAALSDGKLSKYVVDFPNGEVLNTDGVIPIPHLGASTAESEDNCAIMAAEELSDYLLTGNIKNSVNFPNCTLPTGGAGRIAIAHKNIPNMISRCSSAISESGINISDMINASRGEAAYSIFNLDHEASADLKQKLEAVEGVLKVRIIY